MGPFISGKSRLVKYYSIWWDLKPRVKDASGGGKFERLPRDSGFPGHLKIWIICEKNHGDFPLCLAYQCTQDAEGASWQ